MSSKWIHPVVGVCSESPGGGASLLSAEGETRRTDQQSRRFNEEGEDLLFLCELKSQARSDGELGVCAERRHSEAPGNYKTGAGGFAESQTAAGQPAGKPAAGEEEHGEIADRSRKGLLLRDKAPGCLSPHQANQQQQEVQQLNQDRVQQQAEMTVLRSSLENKEKVRLIRITCHTGKLLIVSLFILMLSYLRRDLGSAAAWQLCRQSGRCCSAPPKKETLRSPP